MRNKKGVIKEWEKTWKNFPQMKLNFLARFYLGFVKRSIKKILKNIPKDSKVLDVGCGTGRSMLWYKKMGFKNIEGIDTSETAIQFCHKELNLKVYYMDAFDTNFEDQEIDLIHSEGLIEHFAKINLQEYVKEMCRISKKYVLLVQPNRKSLYRKLADIYYKFIPEKGPPEQEYEIDEFIAGFKKENFMLLNLKTTPLNGFWIMLFGRLDGDKN